MVINLPKTGTSTERSVTFPSDVSVSGVLIWLAYNEFVITLPVHKRVSQRALRA